MIPVKKKRTFWKFSCNNIFSILCAAAIPIALGIYIVITYKQEQEQAMQTQELSVTQTIESTHTYVCVLFYRSALSRAFSLPTENVFVRTHESNQKWSL